MKARLRLVSLAVALGASAAGTGVAVLWAQSAPPMPPMPPGMLAVTNAAAVPPAVTNSDLIWATSAVTAPPPTTSAVVTAPAANTNLVPKIQFATPVYDFGKLKVNEPVRCDFIFTNIGQALLEITAVHPGCGCTTAGTWTRQVEPGKTGTIPIQFNGAGVPGVFGKGVTVTCNDPARRTVILQIKGLLWKPVDVVPPFAVFNVTAESVSNVTSIVRVINNEDEPLTLSEPESNSRFFAAELRTNQPGKEFHVVVRPVPPLNGGNTPGAITLKTSSTNAPVITINTTVILLPTLVASPPSIMLPPAPNTNNVRPVVHVRNNGPSSMRLTEPVVNAQGVDVQIREIEPGRFCTVTLTFPQDFTIPPGEKIELKVKTGLAQPSTLQIPVFQRPGT